MFSGSGTRLVAVLLVAAGWGMAMGQTCTAGAELTRERAVATVSAAQLRVPEKAWGHYRRAVEASQAGRTEEMEREVTKALAVAPAFAGPYVLRASQEVKEGRLEAAIEDAMAARRVDPNAFWAGVTLAGAYNGLRRYREAATVLESLPQAQAETWQAKYEMARAVVGLADAVEALHWSALALDAAPVSCIDTRLLRADAFLLAQRWSEAVAELTVYTQSEQPQFHRAQVLQVLERARRLAAEQEVGRVASAGELKP